MKYQSSIRKILTLALIASPLIALSPAFAIEPQDPKTLCERFVTPLEKTTCEDQMRAIKPDWYLASLCAKQFEDKAFYSCLNITRLGSFSPEKLDRCTVTETTDDGRMDCARASLATKTADAYQSTNVPKKARQGSFRVSGDGY